MDTSTELDIFCKNVKKEATVKFEQELSADIFRRYEWDKGNFIWIETPDTSISGEQTGKIQVFPFNYVVTLYVEEPETEPTRVLSSEPTPVIPTEYSELNDGSTSVENETNEVEEEESTVETITDVILPTLVLIPKEIWLNKPLEATDFVDFEASKDDSGYFFVFYETEPDWVLEGEQEITIIASDAAGNCTKASTTLLIKRDENAPIVTVTDIDVQVGGTVSYKKAISYFDDIDTKDELHLTVERSAVNLKEIGTYDVIYTVTDSSGNSTTVVGKVNVLEESPEWEDEELIHKKAQEILASIFEEGMTDREKALAIYVWLKSNVDYIEHSEKGNYIRGAYEGLFKEKGNCFVYAATAKELLTVAGIPNIDIKKSTDSPSHYWNLVYIEDAWYHFDATPRYDKNDFFLITDAELEEYSLAHNNTHLFDRSLYPEIQ